MKFLIQNQLSEIKKVSEIIEEMSKSWKLSMRIEAQLDLVLDELLSNIIKYAYEDKNCHDIEVNVDVKNNQIFIKVIDDGIEFNPLLYPEPDLNPDLAERQIGGLGIHIIRKLTQEFNYDRKNGCNIQVLIKHIDA
jgi:anti-sigma regulatory factor (Ser/Thr protein kinase)